LRDGEPLGQILLRSGVIDEHELRAALDAHRARGHRLGITLVQLGFLEEHELVRALARQLGLPIASLRGKTVEREVLDLVPRELAEKHNVLPLFVRDVSPGRVLHLGMEDPSDVAARAEVESYAGMAVEVVLVAASDLAVAIDRLYRVAPPSAPPIPDAARLGSAVPTMAPLAPADLSAQATPAAAEPRKADPETRIILQALTQLLLEKGVVGHEELLGRIALLERPGGEDG